MTTSMHANSVKSRAAFAFFLILGGLSIPSFHISFWPSTAYQSTLGLIASFSIVVAVIVSLMWYESPATARVKDNMLGKIVGILFLTLLLPVLIGMKGLPALLNAITVTDTATFELEVVEKDTRRKSQGCRYTFELESLEFWLSGLCVERMIYRQIEPPYDFELEGKYSWYGQSVSRFRPKGSTIWLYPQMTNYKVLHYIIAGFTVCLCMGALFGKPPEAREL